MASPCRAIILAAGEGTRLKPFTADRPKCMVTLNQRPLLEFQISALRKAGIEDIIVIGGYCHERLPRGGIKVALNPDWAATNMVFTLFCGREFLDEDFIVAYSDIVYRPDHVVRLIAEKDDAAVVVDRQWYALWSKRFDNPLADAESLKLNAMGYIIDIGRKITQRSEAQAQYIGLLKFCAEGRHAMLREYEAARAEDREQNGGVSSAKFKKMFMTDFLQLLLAKGHKLKGVTVDGGWLEVDSVGDLTRYEELYRTGELQGLIDLDSI